MKREFESIYKNKIWYRGSGSGSLPSNTVSYRKFLKKYIKKNNIKKIIDIGCGDWKFSKLMDWSGLNYLGIDVVKDIISEDKNKWTKPNIKFKCGDVLKMNLPKADLVIIKDVFQHWPNDSISDFLPELKKYKHVLVVNSIDEIDGMITNANIKTGQARPIDLSREPFNYKVARLFKWRSWRLVRKVWENKTVVELVN